MNIFTTITNAKALFEQGKAMKGSTILTNVEAGSAMLYAFLSALVELLKSLGIDVNIGGVDLHIIANGWSTTAVFAYGVYRIATNPAAGISTTK